jgi:RNA polymerase sigma factor (sigma-70 family)
VLFAQYGPSLSRLAASYTKGSHEREDLLQDIAMAIWQALPRFRGECSERTFIFRVAHNRGISHIARRRLPVSRTDQEPEVPDARPDQAAALLSQGQQTRLLEAIRRLPIGYRQVVTLTLEDLTYGEIGEVLGISEGNVGARLSRARQMLRRLLQQETT